MSQSVYVSCVSVRIRAHPAHPLRIHVLCVSVRIRRISMDAYPVRIWCVCVHIHLRIHAYLCVSGAYLVHIHHILSETEMGVQ